MDTMKITKIVAGLCGSLLVFMLGGWLASSIYGGGGGHHGEEGEHAQGYVIEVAEGGGEGGGEGPSFEELMAAADPAKGEKVFGKCKACHSVAAGENKIGPSLHGVVGRAADSISGFSYSGALEKVADTWTPENLFHFLENPKGFAPGTSMGFKGLKKGEDRANLISYLEAQGG